MGAAVGLVLAVALLVLPDRIESDALAIVGALVLLLFPAAPLLGYDLASGGGPLQGSGLLSYAGSYLAASGAADLVLAAALLLGVALADGPPGATYAYGVLALSVTGAAATGRLGAVWLLRKMHVRPGALVAGALVAIVMGLVGICIAVVAGVSAADSARGCAPAVALATGW